MATSACPANTTEQWADKYRPQSIAQMCYPSSANKLKAWIELFNAGNSKTRGALLSGPPGVGKTTSVYVVARELGLVVVEYNASDFRSRKSLHEHVTDVINNRTFSDSASSYAKIVLLMDEVDGCDIGGVGEIIQMIKTTTIPIVCTCNDRCHQKLRSLINHVEDIRVTRPPCNIVANYICDKVLAREGVSLSKPLLQDIIQRSGSDIRNILNSLQMWCINRKSLDQKTLATCAKESEKNTDVGIFEAAEMFLMQGTSRGRRHSIEELQAAFYNSDMVDLFVQENYIHFKPDNRDGMGAVADAAKLISSADQAKRIMYYEQNWSVSRAYVHLSSIAPCAITRGHYDPFVTGPQAVYARQNPVKFPSWLGHNSSANKNKRLLRCLTLQAMHPTKGISGNQEDVLLDYIPLGWERALTQPLVEMGKEAIEEVIKFMDLYHIMRDDWEFIQDASHFKKMQSSSRHSGENEIPSAVKSAFTRWFNKTHHCESFAKRTLQHIGSDTLNDEDEATDNDADDIDDVKRVVAKKPAAKASTGGKKSKTEKPKTKQPRAKKAATKRTRKQTMVVDSEDEFVANSSDDD